jgi:hypothetical protein
MIEQMQEARAQHTALIQLRESLSAYFQSAKERYPQNSELQEVLQTALYTIKSAPVPDDRATYVNERYYSRRAKWNIKAQADQERKRRLLGIPEKREAMDILRARNAATRGLAVDTTLASAQGGKSDQERAAEQLLAEIDFPQAAMPSRTHSRPGLKLPRNEPDDPDLEFETPEELAPIANLPTGAVAIIDPLAAGENNSPKGVDNEGEPGQDGIGNGAKESKP